MEELGSPRGWGRECRQHGCCGQQGAPPPRGEYRLRSGAVGRKDTASWHPAAQPALRKAWGGGEGVFPRFQFYVLRDVPGTQSHGPRPVGVAPLISVQPICEQVKDT